jgi:peptidoglycan/LPS O-acetylase OafA/YrhL
VALGWVTLAGNPLASNGWMGVNLFFCSAAVLYLPYCAGRRHFALPADRVWFWRHRAARLLPLFYLSLLVGLSVSVSASEFTHPSVWAQTFMALSGLFVLCPWTFMPIGNGVLWSLGVEVLFSAVFPYLDSAARRLGMTRLLLIAVLSCMVCRAAGYVWFREPGMYLNFLSDGLAGRLEDFLWECCARGCDRPASQAAAADHAGSRC